MKIKSKYFKPDKYWEYNTRFPKTSNKWLLYGEGYLQAIELLSEQILKVDRSNQDFLIFPYCQLIRHYIELRLKEVIDQGSSLVGIMIDPTEGGHNLSKLWMNSRKVLKLVWKNQYEEAPKKVSEFILEFHLIDVKSENFRYPIDKKGNNTLENIEMVNFEKLTKAFDIVKNYLEGINEELEVAKEIV